MELVGWKVFYDDGTECSSQEKSWEELPLDGVLAVVEYYSDGSRTIHHSRDYYILSDGKAFGTNDIHPYIRKLKTVKYGRWSRNGLFKEILSKARGDNPFEKK